MTANSKIRCIYAPKAFLKLWHKYFNNSNNSNNAKVLDPEMGHNTKKQTEWTFWGIFINHGLKGSFFNLFLLNPIVVLVILCEFAINSINTYSTTIVVKELTTIKSQTPISHMPLLVFVFLLIGVLFASDISNIIKSWTRPMATIYKTQINERILTTIVAHLEKASHETDKEYGIGDKSEALNKFTWVYDNIIDTIIDATVQTTRSMALCMYIVYQEPLIFFVLVSVYYVIWKYVIPYINIDQKKNASSQKFWERTYYDIATNKNTKINPLYKPLYRDDDIKLENKNGLIDIENATKIEAEYSKDGSTVRPNIVQRYMEIIRFYASKRVNWDNSYELLQTTQHIIISLILISMFYTGRYETAIVILINRYTMFSMINTFSNLSRIEQNAERSLEPVQKILMAIDKQLEDKQLEENVNSRTLTQLISTVSRPELRQRVRSVYIDSMKIPIPAQKVFKNKGPIVNTENKELLPQPVQYDRYVYLESAHLNYDIGKALLIEGITGCGKSITVNALAGLYTKLICNSMVIDFSDGTHVSAEFNSILGSRCYISQMLSDEYKFHGKITLPLFKLFPGARDIEEITDFLVNVFAMNPASIPEAITEHPHSKLSGGEIQRYVVATQIWQALRIKPDMLILDEIDRALDKETAVKVMSWIITNVKCFFVIVSHLSEVKQMLMEKRCVSQIWSYSTSESDKQQIKINTYNIVEE